jgi:hypothetical protein
VASVISCQWHWQSNGAPIRYLVTCLALRPRKRVSFAAR